jgi:membrane-associated phospholipid phosphatase
METSKQSTLIKVGLIFLYFTIVIGIEPLYRNVLFEKSIPIEKSWQPEVSEKMLTLYKFISHIGANKALHLLTLFIFQAFFPLSKSYALICAFCYSAYLNGLLKMIYGNIRPFWVDNSLGGDCEGSWGNPSGHSMFAATFYLSLWDLLTDIKYFHENKIAKYVSCIFALVLVALTMISRLVLGAHSINQVIYGGLLGLGVYLLIFHVAEINKLKGSKFFNMFRGTSNIIIHCSVYIGGLLLAIVIYLTVVYDTKDYRDMLISICPTLTDYNLFSHHSMGHCLIFLLQLGTYLGLVFVTLFVQREYTGKEDLFEYWNYGGDMWVQLFRILLCLSMAFPMGFYMAISSNADLVIIFIFKNGFSFFFTGLSLYGLTVYLTVKTRLCNPKILNDTDELRRVEIV